MSSDVVSVHSMTSTKHLYRVSVHVKLTEGTTTEALADQIGVLNTLLSTEYLFGRDDIAMTRFLRLRDDPHPSLPVDLFVYI